MKIQKKIKPELLLKELEALGTVETVVVDGVSERRTKVNLNRTADGYELTGVDEELARPIVEAHNSAAESPSEKEKKDKTLRAEQVLKKLKITKEELKDLLD